MKNLIIISLIVLCLIFIAIIFSSKQSEEKKVALENISLELENKVDSVETEIVLSGCGFDEIISLRADNWYQLSRKELSQIELLSSFTGLPSNFTVLGAPLQNAAAVIFEEERFILLDKNLLNDLDDMSNSYWSSMSILAHEIGHHLAGHTLTSQGSSHRFELEADKYSGYVLYKMGASLEQATMAISTLVGENDSETHPGKNRRIESVMEGWYEANNQRYKSAIPPSPDDSGNEDYIYKEFFPENLVEKDTYESYLEGYGGWGIMEGFEGIILEKGNNNGRDIYQIRILKGTNEFGYLLEEGADVWIHLENPEKTFKPLHHIDKGWLHKIIMVPGRKIQFDIGVSGMSNPFFEFARIQGVPR